MPFSVFTGLQGHWPGFTIIVVVIFQEKVVTFHVKGPSILPFYALYNVLKSQKVLRLSENIFDV